MQGNESQAMILIGVRILRRQRAGNGIHIRLRLLARHARFEARHNPEVVAGGVIETAAERDRKPQLRVIWQSAQIGDSSDDADDSKALVVDANRFANNVRIGVEAPPPQPFAYQSREDFVRMVFSRQEYAPHHWLDAKHRKKRGGNNGALNSLGIRRSRKNDPSTGVSSDWLEDMILIPPVCEVRI